MPDAPRIKQLENFLEGLFDLLEIIYKFVDIIMLDGDFFEFKKEYGTSDDFSLSDVFWTCQMMFSTR